MPPLKRTGKPLGRPPGTVEVIPRHPAWLKTPENYQLLIHWLAGGLPRRLILEYCEDLEIKPSSGGTLGQKLQVLANFAKDHRDEIVLAYDTICATAVGDAHKKREVFLKQQYLVRDILFERMFSEKDASGRTHMVRDFIHLSKDIADLEGFKKGTFDPRQDQALKMLTDYMFPEGENDATPPVDAEVTVLQRRQLPSGQ